MTDEEFKVTNDNNAEWALKKIKEEIEERDRLVAIAQHEINDLNDKINLINEQCENKIRYLKSLLAMYFETVPHKETKTQESYKLLSGSLVFKKPSVKINHDDEKLIKYLKENDGEKFIKIKESVDWAEFKKSLEIMGEDVVDKELGCIIEGCTVEDVPASFDIKY